MFLTMIITQMMLKENLQKILFTGYIRDQLDLSALYANCFGYVHGHQYGGTNPTMINALYLNCQVLALDTAFNREMLENKESILFNKKSISSKFNEFERGYNEFIEKSINYKMPKKYDWDVIKDQYLEVFIVLPITKIGNFLESSENYQYLFRHENMVRHNHLVPIDNLDFLNKQNC